MSDFSDRPFVAGSLIGLRAFGVDRMGRLTSVYNPAVFRPGVNEAKCKKVVYDMARPFAFPSPRLDPTTGNITWTTTTNVQLDAPAVDVLDHTVATLNCTCGYYAYFDGGNDYALDERVAGIIEGTGVCTSGSRGFRASKARLVALITPKRLDSRRWDRVVHNYADVPVYQRKREALAEHPLTDAVPTPESRADFWDMEVPR